MPHKILAESLLLPELRLVKARKWGLSRFLYCEKRSEAEVCPKCATLSSSGYDKRQVEIKDSPMRNHSVRLIITKRRFYCKPCKKPFTEPVNGILPRRRTTQRYRAQLLWACENYTDLKRVTRKFRCSSGGPVVEFRHTVTRIPSQN